MVGLKRLCLTLGVWLAAWPALAAERLYPVGLAFAAGSFADAKALAAHLRGALMDPSAVVAQFGPDAAQVQLTVGGFAAASSDPVFLAVRGAPPSEPNWGLYAINLPADGAAGFEARRLGAAPGPSHAEAEDRTGSLVFIGRDVAGREMSRFAVEDPRVVRYEGVIPGGAFVSRRDVVLSKAPARVLVALPEATGVARLELIQRPPRESDAAARVLGEIDLERGP
jgi:hypothetical protein